MYQLKMAATSRRFVLGLCLLGSLSTLMGCAKGWFRDRSGDYVQETQTEPVLKIPKEIKVEPFSTEYEIPSS